MERKKSGGRSGGGGRVGVGESRVMVASIWQVVKSIRQYWYLATRHRRSGIRDASSASAESRGKAPPSQTEGWAPEAVSGLTSRPPSMMASALSRDT